MTDRIAQLLASAPVLDGHNDLPIQLRTRVGYDLDALDIAYDQTAAGLHTDLPRLRTGGVGAQFWSVYVPCELTEPEAVVATLEQVDVVYRLVQRYPDDLALARTADEVEAAWRANKVASLLGMEGGHSIASSLGVLRMMYALGVRYLTLTHSKNTPWADSATDEPAHGGLTDTGRDVVRECNRLGMLVDLAHVAVSTMDDALDVSTAPAFFSHSNAYALCGHPRNVPDPVLTRVKDSNGIVMLTFVPGYLNAECRVWMDEMFAIEDRDGREARDAFAAANPRPPCSVSDVADHIEHVRGVAGVAHVGLGGDFDGINALPDGLPGVDGYPALLAELAGRGWSDAELAQLTWHNALRVLRDTERAAEAVRR